MTLSGLSFEVSSSSSEELTGASENDVCSSAVQVLLCYFIAWFAVP